MSEADQKARSSETISFSFGENWLEYSKDLTPEMVTQARAGLSALVPEITGKTFVDIGAGSGIVSLSALESGAKEVVSLDRDENSVASCRRMHARSPVPHWKIITGSILDESFVKTLGTFDIVYSWGVLHHTGSMWTAIRNAASLAKPGGIFVIAIYNKTITSPFWLWYKRLYNRSGSLMKSVLAWLLFLPRAVIRALRFRNPITGDRGMNIYYDAVDWAGGLPYEYASFDEIKSFVEPLGFRLEHSTRTNRIGCNEFVFRKI